MNKKYLLYIDILGFEDMVGADAAKIKRLYTVIDMLNVHLHKGFRAIVFSDTILVYNDFAIENDDAHRYAVMFSCEFAQDLLIRLEGQNVFFRAVLEYGEFAHETLSNVQSFFGSALINAYKKEKQLQAIGLFASDFCVTRNQVFPTERFGNDTHFVFLNQSLERLHQNTGGRLPSGRIFVEDTDEYHNILWDLSFLSSVRKNMREHQDQRVRAKHLATYDLYRRRYPDLMTALEAADFQPECICPGIDWSQRKAFFKEETEGRDV